MAHLVKVEEVRKSIAGCEGDDALSMLASAGDMAASLLQGMLKIDGFHQGARTNLFDIHDRNKLSWGDVPLRMRLSTFPVLDSNSSPAQTDPVIEFASDWDGFGEVTTKFAYDWLTRDDRTVAETGVLSLLNHPDKDWPNTRFVSVDFVGGFAEKSDDVGKYYVGVPGWLESAAKLLTIHLYDKMVTAKSSKQSVTPMEVPPVVKVMLDPHMRRGPDLLMPV